MTVSATARQLGTVSAAMEVAVEEKTQLVAEVARQKSVAKKYEVECEELRSLLEQEKTKTEKSKSCVVL